MSFLLWWQKKHVFGFSRAKFCWPRKSFPYPCQRKCSCQAGALEALAGAMLGHPMDVELLKVACGALGTICAGKDAAGRHRADLAAEVLGGWEGWRIGKLDLEEVVVFFPALA